MRIPCFVPGFFALLLALPFQASAQGHAHAHGVGKLNLSQSGEMLTLTLESPLDNILGFERAPKYEKDFARVRDAAAILRAGDKLFVPTPAAGCVLSSVKLASDVIEPKLLGEAVATTHAHDHKHDHKHDHADLDAEYQFRCADAAKLKEVDVLLFERFPRFRQLDVQLATDKAQRGAKLTRKARKLSW